MTSPAMTITLSEFARVMVTDFSVQEILDLLVERVAEVLPISCAGVTLISAENQPHYAAASNPAALRFEHLQTQFQEGPCLQAYQTGQACVADDLEHDGRFPKFGPAAVQAGLRAAFAVPLMHGQTRLGALDLYRTSPGPLSDEQLQEAQTLAGVVSAYLVNAQARADLRELTVQLQTAAHRDPLTGLPNRVLLMDRLAQAFHRHERSRQPTGLLFIDINGFKAINDEYGHGCGDELLAEVARRLARVVRPADTLARLAGDEFVILCEALDDPQNIKSLTARIEQQFQTAFALGDSEIHATASVGMAISGPMSDTPALLLRNADRDMYRRKRARNRRQRFALSNAQRLAHPADLEAALRDSIARDELRLAYQPIVTSATGEMVGVEALLRWKHPTLGDVPPTAIIAFAEQNGMIGDIGAWVLQTACAQHHQWQQLLDRHLIVAVNVSADQFTAPGFAHSIADALTVNDTPPDALILEVTETVLVSDVDRATKVLADLRHLGVGLALDDFGTGYSSLKYLLSFTVNHVKIDRDFIKDLAQDPTSLKIVNAVIALAHDLGVTVVAEGVETDAQLTVLTGLQCDYCQGYYFARPSPPDTIQALLQLDPQAGLQFPA